MSTKCQQVSVNKEKSDFSMAEKPHVINVFNGDPHRVRTCDLYPVKVDKYVDYFLTNSDKA